MPLSASRADADVVVSDAGPLISLGRLDLLYLLPKLFAQVQVPNAVLEECMARPDNVDALRIRAALDQRWLLACGQRLRHAAVAQALSAAREADE